MTSLELEALEQRIGATLFDWRGQRIGHAGTLPAGEEAQLFQYYELPPSQFSQAHAAVRHR